MATHFHKIEFFSFEIRETVSAVQDGRRVCCARLPVHWQDEIAHDAQTRRAGAAWESRLLIAANVRRAFGRPE